MRKELELMETIEKYLKGNLTEAEKIAFEKRMQAEPDLKKEVQLQNELMQGINRVAIKQSAKQGLKKYKFNKSLKNWGLMGLTVAVLATSSVFLYRSVNKNSENAPQKLPELNEQGNKLWSDADRYLPLQNFDIDTEKDTVIETKDGIVFAIPAHSFIDSKGKPATGNIQLEIKEALKAADIMKAGLSTKSGNKLLETGGMFYINARKDAASLRIDPKNTLYAEIPAEEVKPGMQLFEGKRLPNGTIDWVNPKPIQKDLIPVDILSLDFYPQNYIDSLKKWGYNTKDKKFTDSLYYAFASLFSTNTLSEISRADTIVYYSHGDKIFKQNCAVCHSIGANKITGLGLRGVLDRVPSEDWLKKWIKNNKAVIASGDAYAKKIYVENNKADMTVFASTLSDEEIFELIKYFKNPQIINTSISGINPAKIKTIWNDKFQNTLLATREFEERLPYIFNSCNEGVLDLYINNLDKDLSTIDSMVGAWEIKGSAKFKEFAARGDGKVKNGTKNVELLKVYYKQKSKIYTEAISKTVNEFWKKETDKNLEAENKRNDHATKDIQRTAENFKKELDLNLDEAYHQLGKERPKPTPSEPYGVHVATTGWFNVDAYVIESTTDRTTLNYTDPQNGKKAIIKYEPLSVTVTDEMNYDRVLVYLIPDELNSFMRVQKNENAFEEKLNELMIYKMVCIAYKGEEAFYFSQDNVKPGKISVSLKRSSNSDIRDNMNKLGSRKQSKAMNDELSYLIFEKEEIKRQAQITKIKELTNKIRPVIFPCAAAAVDSIKTDSSFSRYTGHFY